MFSFFMLIKIIHSNFYLFSSFVISFPLFPTIILSFNIMNIIPNNFFLFISFWVLIVARFFDIIAIGV